jgi:hypothetical protein
MAQEPSNVEQRTFWVVVEDHQAKAISVLGPLSEDSEWTSRVKVARERGRDVTISTVASELDAKAMTRQLTKHGFTEIKVPTL